MKKLKIISALSIVALMLGESTYAIIFTGPARRQAHRQQQQQAYMEGMAAGQNMENYADDANVTIQTVGQTPTFGNRQMNFGDGHLLGQLSPEDKKFIMQKIAERRKGQNVAIQAIESEIPTEQQEPNSSTEQPVTAPTEVTPALQEAGVHEEPAQERSEEPAQNEQVHEATLSTTSEITMQPVEEQTALESNVTAPVTQEIHAAIKVEENTTAAPITQLTQVIQEEKPAEQKEALPTSSTPENVKIVKVYPVYEGVVSGITNIKNAAIDMLNHIHAWAVAKLKTK